MHACIHRPTVIKSDTVVTEPCRLKLKPSPSPHPLLIFTSIRHDRCGKIIVHAELNLRFIELIWYRNASFHPPWAKSETMDTNPSHSPKA